MKSNASQSRKFLTQFVNNNIAFYYKHTRRVGFLFGCLLYFDKYFKLNSKKKHSHTIYTLEKK